MIVVGKGKSGLSAKELLESLGHKVELVETDANAEALAKNYKEKFIVVSPGINKRHNFFKPFLKRGIMLESEVNLGLKYIKVERIIGITGTNGKTTTVMLIAHILNSLGIEAIACGNIGLPVSNLAVGVAALGRPKVAVIELSSFMLDLPLEKKLDIGVVLNIGSGHADFHGGQKEYAEAKMNIKKAIKDDGLFFMPTSKGYEQNKEAALFSVEEIIKRMAKDAVQTFNPPAHRMEKVKEMGGVTYINNSKSTNIESTVSAIDSIDENIVLIMCGKEKTGQKYLEFFQTISSKVVSVIVTGEISKKVVKAGKDLGVAVLSDPSFENAVNLARQIAKYGETVLFSPTAQSFDQFKNFEHRGDCFKHILK